jgi:hypothetical protein
MRGRAARIELLLDGEREWTVLRDNLPWKGTTRVDLPKVNSPETRIRVVLAKDRPDAKPWESTRGPFAIKTPPPKATIKEVE